MEMVLHNRETHHQEGKAVAMRLVRIIKLEEGYDATCVAGEIRDRAKVGDDQKGGADSSDYDTRGT